MFFFFFFFFCEGLSTSRNLREPRGSGFQGSGFQGSELRVQGKGLLRPDRVFDFFGDMDDRTGKAFVHGGRLAMFLCLSKHIVLFLGKRVLSVQAALSRQIVLFH